MKLTVQLVSGVSLHFSQKPYQVYTAVCVQLIKALTPGTSCSCNELFLLCLSLSSSSLLFHIMLSMDVKWSIGHGAII